jgi:hypothetical protein
MAWLRAGKAIPRARVRRHVDNDWMANVTKGAVGLTWTRLTG